MYINWKILKSQMFDEFKLTEEHINNISKYNQSIEKAKNEEKKNKFESEKTDYIRNAAEAFNKAKQKAQKEYSEVAKWCNESGQYHIEEQGEYYAVVENPQPTEEEINQTRIAELKQKLAETDYVVIKIAEGEATEEEYTEVLANRKAWRAEINELEADNA